jgi:myosin heavy subunit
MVHVQTNIGTILISVNPFKKLPLYTPTVMDQYMHKGVKEMPPHTFNIADNAYKYSSPLGSNAHAHAPPHTHHTANGLPPEP